MTGLARTAHAWLYQDAITRTLPDTPPADVSIKAGLLAHGSLHPLRLPGKPSGMMERALAVHSCGGSLGFTDIMSATEFPS